MSCKVKIELEVPPIKKVKVQTEFHTPVGNVDSIYMADRVGVLILYLQRLRDMKNIIEADHQHIRAPLCRELVRERLGIQDNQTVYMWGENLSHFLHNFSESVGYKFSEYEYKYSVVSDGIRWKIEGFRHLFKTEHDAVQWLARSYVDSQKFSYEEVDV